jgi:plastocyanin
MIFTRAIVLLGLATSVTAENLRPSDVDVASVDVIEHHLDLEVMVNGERELFPLLPGTKCPTGHVCRSRSSVTTGVTPMVNSLKSGLNTPLKASMDWQELNNDMITVVKSDEYCTRRKAMARAAGMLAGVAASAVGAPAYAAETKVVKMGSDNGQLKIEPEKITICKGDSVKWVNNKAGPHNVVFDEDAIPSGVDQEAISMTDQLGEEGDSFVMSFADVGEYSYYCEPHRGAGMQGTLVVNA